MHVTGGQFKGRIIKTPSGYSSIPRPTLSIARESVFNISSGEGISQNQIIMYIRDLGMNVQVEYKATRSVDVRKMVLDNKKIRGIWGTRLTPLKNGLESYYQYLKYCK